MSETKYKNVFVDGPISPEKIATSIAHHQVKTQIGAHDIFLGQVRADEIDGKTVQGIDYSAYDDMALKTFHDIREEAFDKFDLTCMHITIVKEWCQQAKFACLYLPHLPTEKKPWMHADGWLRKSKKGLQCLGKRSLKMNHISGK
jgi:uncharacterized protein YkuJ